MLNVLTLFSVFFLASAASASDETVEDERPDSDRNGWILAANRNQLFNPDHPASHRILDFLQWRDRMQLCAVSTGLRRLSINTWLQRTAFAAGFEMPWVNDRCLFAERMELSTLHRSLEQEQASCVVAEQAEGKAAVDRQFVFAMAPRCVVPFARRSASEPWTALLCDQTSEVAFRSTLEAGALRSEPIPTAQPATTPDLENPVPQVWTVQARPELEVSSTITGQVIQKVAVSNGVMTLQVYDGGPDLRVSLLLPACEGTEGAAFAPELARDLPVPEYLRDVTLVTSGMPVVAVYHVQDSFANPLKKHTVFARPTDNREVEIYEGNAVLATWTQPRIEIEQPLQLNWYSQAWNQPETLLAVPAYSSTAVQVFHTRTAVHLRSLVLDDEHGMVRALCWRSESELAIATETSLVIWKMSEPRPAFEYNFEENGEDVGDAEDMFCHGDDLSVVFSRGTASAVRTWRIAQQV